MRFASGGAPRASRAWTRDDGITGEQAALRRVATLVARAAPPEEVFAAVTTEAGRLLGARHARMARYDRRRDQVVATWSSNGAGPTPSAPGRAPAAGT